MEELKGLFLSPAFWVASVVIAFLMSFFASYAKDWTDSWFTRRSARRDAEARHQQADFEAKVEKVKANPYLLSLYQTNIVYQKLRQVLYLIVAYVCLALSLYSILRLDFLPALGLMAFGVVISVFQMASVSRRLVKLRAVVNTVLGDDENHFVG